MTKAKQQGLIRASRVWLFNYGHLLDRITLALGLACAFAAIYWSAGSVAVQVICLVAVVPITAMALSGALPSLSLFSAWRSCLLRPGDAVKWSIQARSSGCNVFSGVVVGPIEAPLPRLNTRNFTLGTGAQGVAVTVQPSGMRCEVPLRLLLLTLPKREATPD